MMFGGSFVAQWGIGVVATRARAASALDDAGGLRVAFAIVLARQRRSTYAWFARGWRRHGCVARVAAQAYAPHAPAHPRHLRHVHGRPRGDRASAPGTRVTGCDANVYPPMSTQLEALGIGLTEGWDPAQLRGAAKDADVFVIGNVVSRGNPLMEAILDAGLPYVSGPQWLYENVLREQMGARGRRHARQDDDVGDARVDPRARRARARAS